MTQAVGFLLLEAGEHEDFISINTWTMLFTLVNLLLLTGVLTFFLYRPVKKILNRRQEEISSTYKEAEESRRRAEQTEAEYAEKLGSVKEEAAAILADANRRARIQADETVQQARDEAAHLMARADEQIAYEKKKAKNELKNEIAGLALSAAEQVVGKGLTDTDHEQLIDEFIAKVGESDDR